MGTMFLLYVLVIAGGLALYITVPRAGIARPEIDVLQFVRWGGARKS